jgi:heme-degrading monooxygenase HmoA
MENRPLIRLATSNIHPEYRERFSNWYNEVYAPMIIKMVEGYKAIESYRIVKESPQYFRSLAIVYFESLDGWMKAQNAPFYKEFVKDQDTMWANRREVGWTALYELIKSFRSSSFTEKAGEFKPEDAPIVHIEGYELPPADEEKYDNWFTKFGNEVYVPLLIKLPGLQQFSRYKFRYTYSPYAVVPKVPIVYPAYVSIIRFEDIKSFENFEKSPELAAFRQGLRIEFPKNLEYKWYVQYQLMRSWRK